MTRIRVMTRDDCPLLADLQREGEAASALAEARGRAVFEVLWPRLMFDNPWPSGRDACLTAEDREGRLAGMLGVVHRPFVCNGQPVTAAVGAELFVSPRNRSQLLGVQLLKRFIDDAEDFAVADIATDDTRRLWTRLGGFCATKYSWNWAVAVSSPAHALTSLAEKKFRGGVGRAGVRVLRKVLARGSARRRKPEHSGAAFEQLSAERWAELSETCLQPFELRPHYDVSACEWLRGRLDFVYRDASFSQAIEVRSARGDEVGWFVYVHTESGIGKVCQFAAVPGRAADLLAAVTEFAAGQGATIVQGPWQPVYEDSLRDLHPIVWPRRRHVLIHSRRPEISAAFRTGAAYLSGIDGEGPLQIWNRPEQAIERMESAAAVGPNADRADRIRVPAGATE